MFSRSIPLEKGSKKLINAWASYDWANSVYSLVISSAKNVEMIFGLATISIGKKYTKPDGAFGVGSMINVQGR